MVTGLIGKNGVIVQSLVVVECRKDQELVAIHQRNLEESLVLERAKNRELAMKTLVRVIMGPFFPFFKLNQ